MAGMFKDPNEEKREEGQPKVRYLVWGGVFAHHHEMIEDFHRHGRPKSIYITDGDDGYLRGTAELYPDSIVAK